MQILFRKIHETRNPFDLTIEGARCHGEFWRSGKHTVTLEGRIEGETPMVCDRCGSTYEEPVKESFSIELVDRPLKVDESLDVIECPDGVVDFDNIFESELTAIKSEYHLCPHCDKEESFEVEL